MAVFFILHTAFNVRFFVGGLFLSRSLHENLAFEPGCADRQFLIKHPFWMPACDKQVQQKENWCGAMKTACFDEDICLQII